MENKKTVCAVVVTYNRKELLMECMTALMGQTRKLDAIYIVDNASTYDTPFYLKANGYIHDDPPHNLVEPWETTSQISDFCCIAGKRSEVSTSMPVHYIRMHRNTGGAGGFYEGVKRGCKKGFDWLWLMDDDAKPEKNALEKLIYIDPVFTNIYGSVASYWDDNGSLKLCFPSSVVGADRENHILEFHADLANIQMVHSIPFLGFLINSKLIEKIGFPNSEFFISVDDVEYCVRAAKIGCKVILVKNSIILHPSSASYSVHFAGHKFYCPRLAPWRRYYDVRNRILIARRHYGMELYTKTLPSLIVRFFASILYEKDVFKQLHAYCKGFIDGMLGKAGERVSPY